jgi:hypothetical protein
MGYTADEMYELLPAVYRQRDAEVGGPLRALLAIIAKQAQVVENDITGLYNNWFIETCDPWVVPYIGDLLDVGVLHSVSQATRSQRARVANTIGYRRRKGTAVMLQQLARDVTGWPARVVEFFELLVTTQQLTHLRPSSLATPDLRDASRLQLIGSAFEQTAHLPEVRHISLGRGRYNLPNIGIFLWRLQPYTLIDSTPVSAGAGLYHFAQLGEDEAIFTRPRAEDELNDLALESQVPGPIRSWALHNDLQDYDATFSSVAPAERPSDSLYYGPDASLAVVRDDTLVPPLDIVHADLSKWDRPPAGKVAVDVCLGRLSFPANDAPAAVRVSYTYAFSGDIGGGPYTRDASIAPLQQWEVTWQIGVSTLTPPVANEIVASLEEAVTAWNGQPAGTRGLIVLLDSGEFPAPASSVQVPAESKLAIIAGTWDLPAGQPHRIVGQFTAGRLRPHVTGDVVVAGSAPEPSPDHGTLVIDGLLLSGHVRISPGNLGTLEIAHTTLVPGVGGLAVDVGGAPARANSHLSVLLRQSISGPIVLPGTPEHLQTIPQLAVNDSVIASGADADDTQPALAAPGTHVSLNACTVAGSTAARRLDASNSIFTGSIQVHQQQQGCLRFSFVPAASQTPRRFRCQPDLEIANEVDQQERQLGAPLSAASIAQIAATVQQGLVPSFTSLRYPSSAYAQLSRVCPEQIRSGADDGSEMGVFSSLQQPQREANLNASLTEYLRFGLEAGMIFVT